MRLRFIGLVDRFIGVRFRREPETAKVLFHLRGRLLPNREYGLVISCFFCGA